MTEPEIPALQAPHRGNSAPSHGKEIKHLHVSCGIIERENRVLAVRRSAAMSQGGKWEFPGGKLHENETAAQCLIRELREELCVDVNVVCGLEPHTHGYPAFIITLYPFICTIRSGDITLQEHDKALWLSPRQLLSLDWAAADLPVVQRYGSMKHPGGELLPDTASE